MAVPAVLARLDLDGHTDRMGSHRVRAELDDELLTAASERGDPPASASRALLALQGTAGNRAVAQALGASSSRRSGDAARYSTTDSAIANAASVIGLGAGAASLTGAVTFTSSGFAATVANPLAFTKNGADLRVASQRYRATGSVTATGPAARIGDYEIGFLQTVFESTRNFYYEPPGHTPGLFEQLLPQIFSDRKKVSDTLSAIPVRDGDAGQVPWYGPETVDQFAATDPSTKVSTMSDTPSSTQPWKLGSGADEQHLVRTDGRDRFRSWLAVKDKNSDTAIPLSYADWEVGYGTTVTVNPGSPAASVVTADPASGAKVTGTGDGSGGIWPLHEDPVANDVATEEHSTW
ncbi:hypothetical protein [Actinoplanes sp. NBRC 103695]|uniref:hypothetical protein n=1 Tax=Actinoplanes sp. NBRC 103695 TaxID=3032202 RepID=UPI002554F8B8|nr:hypothetical protein [Actinoplanes sp. NBRC 103695]